MGLIRAGKSAASSVLGDQWREYFYCDSLDETVLATMGKKRVNSKGSNQSGSDNVITNGSIIAVADGQFMMIVEQGKVVDFCAEPGEFVYDTSTEPSVFYGGLGESLKQSFATFGKRFTFGGDTAKDQRVYYFNTKEIYGNKYGTPNPVPFRVVDQNIGLDVDISIKCHGEYTYMIKDPILFYGNVCGNIVNDFNRSEIDSQLKSELLTALQPAFARISGLGVRYSALPGHTMEISDALNEILTKKWRETRGIEIVEFGVSSVKASEEDENMIKELQRNATFRNANMAAAHLVGAQAQAMQDAAKNEGGLGAMGGFFGMNMAQNAGSSNISDLFAMGQAKPQNQNVVNSQAQASPVQTLANSWKCECGAENQGKFCTNCGKEKPSSNSWICECGSENQGKFCPNCGKARPAMEVKCANCGWKPEDSKNPPKFCPECGTKF